MAMDEAGLDRTMIALSDPTRRAIIARLVGGEARVTEIAEPFEMSLNAVSKHLRILERADLVRREVRGREHHISFNGAPLQAASDWIETYRNFWNQRLDALDVYLRKQEDEKMAAEDLDTTLTITRHLPASPEDVFDAWTTPDILRQWMCPFDTKVVRADLDLRVGGKYHIDMQGEETLHKHEGEYVEIDRPNRLVFTWISAGTRQETTLVTVTFEKSADGTALTLVHDRLPGTEAVGDHNRGWSSALDNLETVVAA